MKNLYEKKLKRVKKRLKTVKNSDWLKIWKKIYEKKLKGVKKRLKNVKNSQLVKNMKKKLKRVKKKG